MQDYFRQIHEGLVGIATEAGRLEAALTSMVDEVPVPEPPAVAATPQPAPEAEPEAKPEAKKEPKARAKKEPETKSETTEVTRDDIKQAFITYNRAATTPEQKQAHRQRLQTILADHGASTLPDLAEDHYAAVLNAVQQLSE